MNKTAKKAMVLALVAGLVLGIGLLASANGKITIRFGVGGTSVVPYIPLGYVNTPQGVMLLVSTAFGQFLIPPPSGVVIAANPFVIGNGFVGGGGNGVVINGPGQPFNQWTPKPPVSATPRAPRGK